MNGFLNITEPDRYIGGPRTIAGKHVVRFNAIKHGVLVKSLAKSELKQAKNLQVELLNEYNPQTITECLLIETMCLSYIRRSRALLAENEDGMMKAYPQDNIETLSKTCDRYVVSCERQFYRALHELQRIQAAKTGSKPTSIAMDVFIDKNED